MSTIINATTTNGVVIQPDNSGSLVLQTNSGTTALTIDTSQNVGIGTASPSSILNVSAASPTILLTATTTTGTTIGNKNNRLLLASNSGTLNNGGEIVFAATDTNVDRWAAISGAIQSNSVSGCYGDILFATKATEAATTLTERMRIASDGTVTIPKGVSGTPAFAAYQSTGVALTAATFTKITFQTEEYDTNSNFASSRFTPTVAGYYQINGAWQFGSGGTVTNCAIYKNGTIYKQGTGVGGTAGYGGAVSSLVYFNGSSDYVELYGYASTAKTPLATIDATYFNGALVRGA